ncbi:MAG TPA: peptide deformylase [Patescibacteria group bacterium]|jgi:peptide deformylase|nr:peptide deformylase [Patescibacteria group bacterium]
MSKAKDLIIYLPNPGLRVRSKKVGLIDAYVKKIISQMEKTVLEWEASREHEVGVALAAIQINQPLRIIIVRNNYDNKDDKSFTVLINPVITKYEGDEEEDFEGCLSVQDIYGKVPRYSKVRVKARGLNGKEFRITAEGFLARVLQHEIDHTNGITFVDHIKKNENAFFKLTKDGQLEQIHDKDVESSDFLR